KADGRLRKWALLATRNAGRRASGLAAILAHALTATRPQRLGVFQHDETGRSRSPRLSCLLHVFYKILERRVRFMHYHRAVHRWRGGFFSGSRDASGAAVSARL